MRKRRLRFLLGIAALIILIIEADIAAAGAQEGIMLSARVVIPSLFPFFLITSYLIPMLTIANIPIMNVLRKCMHTPAGCEGLILLGMVGGYPIGAKAVAQAYERNTLDRRSAQIMLGYCSNAGPAFIFGVTRVLFPDSYVPWLLWVVHIASIITTGILLPPCSSAHACGTDHPSGTLIQALQTSLVSCSSVCGWIIAFKTLLALLTHWFPRLFEAYSPYFFGLLELSGGCLMLQEISSLSVRFILCSAFLSFGGLCVVLQTASVTAQLGLGLYLPGKLMQLFISILLSLPIACMLFHDLPCSTIVTILATSVSIIAVFALQIHSRKKLWKIS